MRLLVDNLAALFDPRLRDPELEERRKATLARGRELRARSLARQSASAVPAQGIPLSAMRDETQSTLNRVDPLLARLRRNPLGATPLCNDAAKLIIDLAFVAEVLRGEVKVRASGTTELQRRLTEALEGIEDREAVIAELRSELARKNETSKFVVDGNVTINGGKINEDAKAKIHASLSAIESAFGEPRKTLPRQEKCNNAEVFEVVERGEFEARFEAMANLTEQGIESLQSQINTLCGMIGAQGVKIRALEAKGLNAEPRMHGNTMTRSGDEGIRLWDFGRNEVTENIPNTYSTRQEGGEL